MIQIPIYQIDAFAERPFQGNPAAVCPLSEWLSDDLLQSIAEENNLSETAFFIERDGVFDIRWFTPNSEVDLCGHATLAAAFVIFHLALVSGSEIQFHSKSGPLYVSKKGDLLALNFPKQKCVACPASESLIQALGRTPESCFRAEDYMVVFPRAEDIASLQPDFTQLSNLDLRGVIITAPGEDVDFVSRFFAPKFGIDEDPVTGSAHCCLAPYWGQRLGKTKLTARQISKRSGELHCELHGDRVIIAGKAILFFEGLITISNP